MKLYIDSKTGSERKKNKIGKDPEMKPTVSPVVVAETGKEKDAVIDDKEAKETGSTLHEPGRMDLDVGGRILSKLV